MAFIQQHRLAKDKIFCGYPGKQVTLFNAVFLQQCWGHFARLSTKQGEDISVSLYDKNVGPNHTKNAL